jgi:hypothetical protein
MFMLSAKEYWNTLISITISLSKVDCVASRMTTPVNKQRTVESNHRAAIPTTLL